ncbi:MFS transporter [Actinoallomurus sp. CA-142502]|uniref:MFS transporter n=1 Tax=Actinoallomurus sp. CA-142502 TaxID=3239885 RepID=UPI003D8F80B6
MAVLVLGTGLPTPLYAVYQARFGFSDLVVTLVFAVYCGTLVLALPLFGPLADAVGPRRVAVFGLVLAVGGATLLALADGVGGLYAGRAFQGLAVGAASGALTAGLVRAEPDGDRERASAVASIALCGGAGLGPMLAGALAQYAPAPRVLCYVVETGLLLALALSGAPTLPGRTARVRWRPARPRVPAAIRRPFLAAASMSALAWAVAALFLTLTPAYTTSLLRTHDLLVAGLSSGLLLLTAACVQPAGARLGQRRARRAGLVLLALGSTITICLRWIPSLPLPLAGVVVAGSGQGLAFMGAVRQVNEIAPDGSRAGVLSAFYVVTYVAEALPVIVVGLLANHVGLEPAVDAFLAVAVTACLCALFASRGQATFFIRNPYRVPW